MGAILVLVAGALIGPPAGAVESVPQDYWRNSRRCGTNCLYAYLRIHGRPVALAQVAERVPLGAKGSNMADLRLAATELLTFRKGKSGGVPGSDPRLRP